MSEKFLHNFAAFPRKKICVLCFICSIIVLNRFKGDETSVRNSCSDHLFRLIFFCSYLCYQEMRDCIATLSEVIQFENL